MSASGHAVRPRPGGGFNQGMGSFGEHLDEAAMQQAVQQKALAQAAGTQSTVPTQSPHSSQSPAPAREPGSLTEELLVRPAQDLVQGLKRLADINVWLGLDERTPEQEQERARKQVILQRFNQLTDEQQAVAKQRYEERLARQRAEEEEKQRQAQLKAQQEQASLIVPSSPQKGPVGPGSNAKQNAIQKLQQDRKQLSQAPGAG